MVQNSSGQLKGRHGLPLLRSGIFPAALGAVLFFLHVLSAAADGWPATNPAVIGANNFLPGGWRMGSHARFALDQIQVAKTGQFASGTEWQAVKFQTPVSGRFFCFDALSAQDDGPLAAVAELQLFDESGRTLNSQGWKIAYADSEEHQSADGSAENVFDDEAGTCWQTRSTQPPAAYPHRLVVDLGGAMQIAGFRYLPRQGIQTVAGRIKDYQILVAGGLKEEKPPGSLLPKNVYLLSYFTADGADGLQLAWSMDGYQWEPLNAGMSVLHPSLTGVNLVRDPCLLRGPDGIFRLVWTTTWAGKSIGYASSKDLIHWSDQKEIPVMAEEPGTHNCWAPEIYWDAKRGQYLIIWASAVADRFTGALDRIEEENNQRIYCTTTKDFATFTPTKLFFDPGTGVIDPTIVFNKGRYYLLFKDETSHPFTKNLRLAVGDDLMGPFQAADKSFSPQWVEGPAAFSADGGLVCIFHFYRGQGWGALKSQDMEHWSDVSERLAMPPNSHPGTVLQVPREILLSLWQAGRAEIGPAPEASDLGLGDWIWTDTVQEKQTCRLWHTFNIPAGTLVSHATLRITADNGYRVFLDGREVGRGGDSTDLTEYDLTQLLASGDHVVAVEGFNDALAAGVILGLHIQMLTGQTMEILSDPSWYVVPPDEKNWTMRRLPGDDWKRAHIVGFAGKFGWAQPKRILTSPPLLPQQIQFWQRGWFLFVLLTSSALGFAFTVRQGLKLTVQTRSQKLLERERDRIARDIHDDLGAGLTQLTLLGELVRRETPPDSGTRAQIDSLCGKSRALLGALDELVWTVNSRRDTVQDFAAFICEHAQEFLATTTIRCRLDVPDDLPPVPLDLPARRNLLLAVKEAVRNAARHSGASELLLQIRMNDDMLHVALVDNGHGFAASSRNTSRNGLRNMEDRLADIGGVCRVDAAPGGGCRIVFILPFHRSINARKWFSSQAGKILRAKGATEPNQ